MNTSGDFATWIPAFLPALLGGFGSWQEWVIAFFVLALTLIAAGAATALLKALAGRANWTFLSELAPPTASLVTVVGLTLFADVAPLPPKAAAWLNNGVYVVGVLVLLSLLRKALMLTVEWAAIRSNQSTTLQQGFIPLMKNVITLFVFLTGAIMVLKHFNYDVLSLLTALGVGSLAVGLADKETLGNMISGFTLIIDRNVRPGDRVNLGGSTGDIEEIGLRSTKIRIGDGTTLIVPNAELVNTKILNLSLPSRELACTTAIRVPCSASFEKIRALAAAAAAEVEAIQKAKKPWIQLTSLSEGHQLITVGFWIYDLDQSGEAASELNRKLLARLTADGIALLPPPTR